MAATVHMCNVCFIITPEACERPRVIVVDLFVCLFICLSVNESAHHLASSPRPLSSEGSGPGNDCLRMR